MKLSNYKKYLLVGAMMALVVLMPFGVVAHAQNIPSSLAPTVLNPEKNVAPVSITTQPPSPNWFACSMGNSIATCGIYAAALFVDNIMTVLVTLGAFLVRLGLQFNGNIFNSPAVQTGFSVVLAVANLGFVLGIIIIALATILRRETYGIKNLLAKLVMMAILVNFGLVIMAPIVGFADSMSNYFVNATSPSAATGGYEAYVTTMAQAFAPQSVNNSTTNVTCASAQSGTGMSAICNTATNGQKTLSAPDSFTQQVLALFFGIAFLALTAFTFLCLAALLIVRYLMLSGLLIVLPVAWLTFVFPKFDSNFNKWWNAFVKWTLFPPIALLFIYLAFITAANTGTGKGYQNSAAGLPANAATGVEGGLSAETGLAGPLQQAADEVLLVGLTIMGLMFAQSLTGKAGAFVVDAGKQASGVAGRYLGKQGKKGARAAFHAAGGHDWVKNARTGEMVPQKLRNIPLVGWAAQKATGIAGRAAVRHITNAEYVDEEEKHLSKNPFELKENLKNGGLRREQQLAIIKSLTKTNDMDDNVKVGSSKQKDGSYGQSVGDFLDAHHADVETYDYKKPAKDVDKAVGTNTGMRKAEKEFNELAAAGQSTTAALARLNDETDKFFADLKTADATKMDLNEKFKDPKSPMAQAIARSLFYNSPRLIGKTFPRMKSVALKNAYETYENLYKGEKTKIKNDSTLSKDAQDKANEDNEEKWKNIKRAHATNAAGLGGGGGGGATPAPSAP